MEGMVYADSAVLLQKRAREQILSPWRPCRGCICTRAISVTRRQWQRQSTARRFQISAALIPASGAERRGRWLIPKPADKKGAQEKRFAQVAALLTERCLTSEKGTIVDFAMISASSSAKNKEKNQGTNGREGRKSTAWRFGYNAYIDVEPAGGLVHTDEATPANAHDVTRASSLPTGEKDDVCCGSGYLGAWKHKDAIIRNRSVRRIPYHVCTGEAASGWQGLPGSLGPCALVRRCDGDSTALAYAIMWCCHMCCTSKIFRPLDFCTARALRYHPYRFGAREKQAIGTSRGIGTKSRQARQSGVGLRQLRDNSTPQRNRPRTVQVLGNDWHHPVWVASFRDRRIKGEPCG